MVHQTVQGPRRAHREDVAATEDERDGLFLNRTRQIPVQLVLEAVHKLWHDAQSFELTCAAL